MPAAGKYLCVPSSFFTIDTSRIVMCAQLAGGSAGGALLLLAHSLWWRVLASTLNFESVPLLAGVLPLGPSASATLPRIWTLESLIEALRQQTYGVDGAGSLVAGALLGYASVVAWQNRANLKPEARRRARETCRAAAHAVAWPVGAWNTFVLFMVLDTGFNTARLGDGRSVSVLLLVLAGVLCNLKLWWCCALWRFARQPNRLG